MDVVMAAAAAAVNVLFLAQEDGGLPTLRKFFFQINVTRHAAALQAEHYKGSQEVLLFFFLKKIAKMFCLLLFSCDSLQQR